MSERAHEMPPAVASNLVATLASLLVWAFGVVVLFYGVSGILFPDVWLHSSALLDLPAMDPLHRATFLSEFRFLHGREVGVGLYALVMHKAILSDRRMNIVFLVVAFIAPLGRAYSCLVDGASNPLWLGFMAFELTACVGLLLLTRHVWRRPVTA